MIGLYVYGAGVFLVLVGHGVFGSWQDDSLGVFNALIWPLFIPFAILLLPLKLARLVSDRTPRHTPERNSR